jgi:hypothetical protein
MRLLLLPAVPAHSDPYAEHQVARDVEEEHQQEPPHLDLELEVRLVLDVHPHEVEADDQDQEEDQRDLLEDHEQQHGGHPTTGVSR